jgi:hypothetical protein
VSWRTWIVVASAYFSASHIAARVLDAVIGPPTKRKERGSELPVHQSSAALPVLRRRQVDVLAALAPRPDATLAPGAPALYAVGTPLMANVAPESIFPRLPQRQPPVRIPHRGR